MRPVKIFPVILAMAAVVIDGLQAGEVSVTLTPSVVSEYMFRGVRAGGLAFQPTVELSSGNFGVGVWASTFLNDRMSGDSDPEVDPYAYYTFKVNEHLTLTPGFSVYTYPDADESEGYFKSTFEPYLGLNYTIGGVTLAPKIYYDTVQKGATYELNSSYSVPLTAQKTSLDFAFTIGTYSWKNSVKGATPELKNRGDYFQIGVSSPFQLAENLTLTAGVAYHRGFNNRYESASSPTERNPDAVGRWVVSLSCASSF